MFDGPLPSQPALAPLPTFAALQRLTYALDELYLTGGERAEAALYDLAELRYDGRKQWMPDAAPGDFGLVLDAMVDAGIELRRREDMERTWSAYTRPAELEDRWLDEAQAGVACELRGWPELVRALLATFGVEVARTDPTHG